jgi:hypothetical protein
VAKTIATTMKIHAASGAGRERCAFTVGRWDARRPPAHDTGEVCLLALTGTQCSLIFRVEGLFGGVWRSTSGGEVHLAVPGTIYRFTHNGAAWDRTEVSMPGVFADLWGAWDDLAFGWGLGEMIRWDGAAWSRCESPGEVYAVHGARRDMIFAAGRGGLLARWDGGAWQRMEPPCTDDLIAVHAAADDDVWAIAKSGTLLHGSTLGLRPVLTTDRKLRAVVRFRGAVYVGIEDEGLFRFEDGALTLVKDSFKPHRLEARDELLCTSGEHLVGSADGVAFKGTALKVPVALIEARAPLWT